jgi:uncharacterized coiled-coil protein SlyX
MQVNIQVMIAISTFLITIGTLIWRMAILHHQTLINKEATTRAHERINKLENTQTNKIEELSKSLNTVREAQIRMEEKINLLIKSKERTTIKSTKD